MTVTAKEERDIVAECKEAAEDGQTQEGEVAAAAESSDSPADDSQPPSVPESDLGGILGACLDEKLAPLAESAKSTVELAEATAADVKKLLDIYNLMTESRNRATLLLTKHIEMYERLKALADFCRENVAEGEGQTAFEKSLLARTGNIARVASRTLGSFGVLPIWPERNDAFDENLHQIISETSPDKPGDVPGAIAECLKMGIMRDGIVAKAAEVVLFRNLDEPAAEATV